MGEGCLRYGDILLYNSFSFGVATRHKVTAFDFGKLRLYLIAFFRGIFTAGVEAAAFTYLSVDTTSSAAPSKEEEAYMILNRPFLYGIQTDNTYTFLGVCQDPTVEE